MWARKAQEKCRCLLAAGAGIRSKRAWIYSLRGRQKSGHRQTSAAPHTLQAEFRLATSLLRTSYPNIYMLRTLFVLAILVPGFLLSLRSRYIALLMYLWFALFRPQDWMWIDVTSLRLSLLLGLILLVPSILSGRFPNMSHPLSIGMILFVWSASITQTVAIRPDVGWVWIDFLVRLFLASMMIVTCATDAPKVLGVIAVIGGSLGFHASKAGLAYVLGGGTRFADGLAGAFVDNNGYALATVMIIPLLLATAQNIDLLYSGRFLTWVRRGLYLSIPLCMFAVIGTYSRGGFISLAVITLVFATLQDRRVPTLAGLAAIVTVALLVVPIPQSYVDRLQTIQTYNEIGEESAMSRPHFWQVGMRMVSANPLGVGLKQYEAAYDKYDFSYGRYGHHRAVHSSHVQVFAELGYPGIFIWVGLFMFAFHACLRVRRRARAPHLDPRTAAFLKTTANALIISMTGFLVGGSFLSLAVNDLTWLTFGIVGALDRFAKRVAEAPEEVPADVAGVPVIRPVPVMLSVSTPSRGH
jgi:putative inorganic carbon (hco3(-)) transporter